jgi:hypothetical protein
MSSDSTFRPLPRPASVLAPVVPAPAGLNKGELFDHIAREHDGFAFTPEDAPKLAALRGPLGTSVASTSSSPAAAPATSPRNSPTGSARSAR